MSARARRSAALLAVSASLLAACGGDDGGPQTVSLNAVEAQAVAGALFVELINALPDGIDAARSGAAPSGLAAARHPGFAAARLRAADRLRAASAAAAETINHNCERGGTISLTVDYTDTVDDNGTGSLTGLMEMAPRGCVVSTGDRTLTVDGDPSLKYSYSSSYANGQPNSDFVWKATGGIKWNGGGCSMNYTMRMSPNGSGSLVGTICGQSVNQAFDADD